MATLPPSSYRDRIPLTIVLDSGLALFFLWTVWTFYISQLPASGNSLAMGFAVCGIILTFLAREYFCFLLLVATIPLSEAVSRWFSPPLAPFSIALGCTFGIAFIVKSHLMPGSGGEPGRRSQDHASGRWLVDALVYGLMALIALSAVFVLLEYSNLYPLVGDEFVNYEINRGGQRTLEAFVHISSTVAAVLSSLLLLVFFNHRLEAGRIPAMLAVMMVTIPAISLVAFLQQSGFLGWMQQGGIWQTSGRLNATFTDPNALATWVVLAFPVAVLGALDGSWMRRILFALAGVLSLYLVFVTASKTAFWGLAIESVFICAVILALGIVRRKRATILTGVALLAAGAGAVLYLLLHAEKALLAKRVEPTLRFFSDLMAGKGLATSFNQLESFRLQWWGSAFQMLRDDPLSGVGFGAFPFETINHGVSFFDSAGNFYLQVAAELGLPGVLFFTTMTVMAAWMVLRLLTRANQMAERHGFASLGVLVSFVTMGGLLSLGSHLLFHQVACFFVLFAGVLLAYFRDLYPPRTPLSSTLKIGISLGFLALISVMALSSLAGLAYSVPSEFRAAELGRKQDLFGYGEERAVGPGFRWLPGHSAVRIRTDEPELAFEVFSAFPGIAARPVQVSFSLEDQQLGLISLEDNQWHPVRLPVSRELRGRPVLFQISTSYTWSPADFGSKDNRILGAAIRGLDLSALQR